MLLIFVPKPFLMFPHTCFHDFGPLCISRPFPLWLGYRLSAGGTRASYWRTKPCWAPSLASLRRPLSPSRTISSPALLSLSVPSPSCSPLHPVVLLLLCPAAAHLSGRSLCFIPLFCIGKAFLLLLSFSLFLSWVWGRATPHIPAAGSGFEDIYRSSKRMTKRLCTPAMSSSNHSLCSVTF